MALEIVESKVDVLWRIEEAVLKAVPHDPSSVLGVEVELGTRKRYQSRQLDFSIIAFH
jgi:hypothetical protein